MFQVLILVVLALFVLEGTTGSSAQTIEVRASRDGKLSVELQDAPLERVLSAIAQALEAELLIDGIISRTVSDSFAGIEPDRAIRRLVQHLPTMIRWDTAGDIRSIRVHGEQPGDGPEIQERLALSETRAVADPAEAASADPMAENAASSMRVERRLALRIRQPAAEPHRPSRSTENSDLTDTLANGDLPERRAAIQTLAHRADGAAAAALGEVLETEVDPMLRRMALSALARIDDPLARDLLEAAIE